jgi:hypothetical protein
MLLDHVQVLRFIRQKQFSQNQDGDAGGQSKKTFDFRDKHFRKLCVSLHFFLRVNWNHGMESDATSFVVVIVVVVMAVVGRVQYRVCIDPA